MRAPWRICPKIIPEHPEKRTDESVCALAHLPESPGGLRWSVSKYSPWGGIRRNPDAPEETAISGCGGGEEILARGVHGVGPMRGDSEDVHLGADAVGAVDIAHGEPHLPGARIA